MSQPKQAEPPSYSRPSLFMIGRDDQGNWVVQHLHGICGGLFLNRKAAFQFVRCESGRRRPPAVLMISGVLDLDMTCKPTAAPHGQAISNGRRAA